ncbi:MAG: hypothetical protein Q9222_001393 [Ikaeria aurantiellina]
MSAGGSNGSPPPRSRPSNHFKIHDDTENSGLLTTDRQASSMAEGMLMATTSGDGKKNKHSRNSSNGPSPLSTSKLGNIQPPTLSGSSSHKAKASHHATNSDLQENTMDALLAKLTEQQRAASRKPSKVWPMETKEKPVEVTEGSSSSSIPITPASGAADDNGALDSEPNNQIKMANAEMIRLQQELNAAKQQLEMQKRELDQNRMMSATFEQAVGPSVDDVINNKASGGHNMPRSTITQPQPHPHSLAPSQPTSFCPDLDTLSDISDAYSASNYNVGPQNIWSTARSPFNPSPTRQQQQFQQPMAIWSQAGVGPGLAARPWNPRLPVHGMPPAGMLHHQPMHQQRVLPAHGSPGTIGDGRFLNDMNQYQPGYGVRHNTLQNTRMNGMSPQQRDNKNAWPAVGNNVGALDAMSMGVNSNSAYQPMGMYQPGMPYQPRPIGTPLSPTATDFQADQPSSNPWNTTASSSPGQVYVQPMEPLNYRRLLDRSVSCNWKYIVDKIVCNNDQQASIFLQQKLKVGTVEQKYEIIEAIVAQAYPLMVNRFGNFLVQRCFEHGTPEQVVAIANAIRGNTLSLSMDAFGCHVVQKAFDAVPEEYKAIMVHELLRRIPETVIHRYACHVWQKLFELRWADSPPQIMKYVNEALRGMWHDVALGETGSLVVQNIFENCLEEDKRPCINEVLGNIDIVAHGQFGNWCIQHICEHGAPQDRSRAIDHVLRYATEYSMDQFASKVVEKCLKIGGTDFLERYLERVCEGRADRPRIPLIDIASDQYGNYLIQYILGHANNTHREIVASNVRKHMVSLRGSKFGSRVGMLCCNPAYATHPGPGAGMSNPRYPTTPVQGPRFAGPYR